jgi:hypothetical protein
MVPSVRLKARTGLSRYSGPWVFFCIYPSSMVPSNRVKVIGRDSHVTLGPGFSLYIYPSSMVPSIRLKVWGRDSHVSLNPGVSSIFILPPWFPPLGWRWRRTGLSRYSGPWGFLYIYPSSMVPSIRFKVIGRDSHVTLGPGFSLYICPSSMVPSIRLKVWGRGSRQTCLSPPPRHSFVVSTVSLTISIFTNTCTAYTVLGSKSKYFFRFWNKR